MRDQTAQSVQSDLDLHCPQKLLVSSPVRKELNQTSLTHQGLANRNLKLFFYLTLC